MSTIGGGIGADPCGTQRIRACGAVACQNGLGAVFCNKVVTFSVPFSKAPSVKVNAITPVNVQSGMILPSVIFMSGTSIGQIWTSFPVGTTEIFADAGGQHQARYDFRMVSLANIEVVCITASANFASYLTPQWSSDNGATWNFLDTISGTAIRVFIDGISMNFLGSCAGGGSTNVLESGYFGLNTNLNNLTPNLDNLLLRIVGVGGAGVGDNPAFTQIKLLMKTNGIINPNIDVLFLLATAQAILITPTQFTYRVNIAGVLYGGGTTTVQLNVTSTWEATL